MDNFTLPKDSPLMSREFLFGVATSSYQIEGAANEGGRGKSIWDTFCRQKGAVENFENGDVACDHYHRWKEDIDLIADLGVGAYRLSIAWPRIQPSDGAVNQEGLDFYDKIISRCHEKGLQVFVTLYHWDLPQYLEDRGGWLNRETAYKFAEYADIVSSYFGDKIDTYTTLNEPLCSAYLGYGLGVHAPGVKGDKEGFQASHHLMLAHGLAMPILRKNAPNSSHGIVVNAWPSYPLKPEDQVIADYADAEGFHWFIDPLLKGSYPQAVREHKHADMPLILKGDMEIISAPIDYLGVNYYSRNVVTRGQSTLVEFVPQSQAENTDMGWEIYPDGLRDLLVRLKERYPNLPPIYIAENGAACDDELIDGVVNDQQRLRYFQGHLNAVDEAIKEGIAIHGYFAWSLMDNFEWSFGYGKRFGIVYVDYATQQRTLKNSAIAFKHLLAVRRDIIQEKHNG